MMLLKRAGSRWGISVIYLLWLCSLASVVYLSLKPSPEVPDLFWNADKVIHCLAYLWLALLPAFVVKPPQRLVLVCVGLFLLGVTLEFGQMYIPGRTFSLADMGANGIGVGLGFSIGKRVAAHGLFKFFLKI